MSELSTKQKKYLAQLARQAFKVRGTPGADFDEWRHEQVANAVGKAGLRCCSQIDYKAVESHFLDMTGRSGRAMTALVQHQSEPRRQAEAVLLRELAAAGQHINYANAICRSQFKCGLFDASEKQIWCLVYTVRNRASGKRRTDRVIAAGLAV
jgi:hypothetical protein